MHTYIPHINTSIYTFMHTYIHINTCIHTLTHTYMHTHTRIHDKCTHAHTYTNAYSHCTMRAGREINKYIY